MNVIFASSRGFGLNKFLPSGTTVEAISGGTIGDLTEKAKLVLPPPYGLKQRVHAYFLCGIPDITTLAKDDYGYRECIYLESPLETADRYLQDLEKCRNTILELGSLPIFATIPKCNLEIYNNHMLNDGSTSQLKYQDQYAKMQDNLNQAIDSINGRIYRLNKQTQVSTPFLHCSIMEHRGRKNKRYYVYKYDRYRDGLHAPDPLKKV